VCNSADLAEIFSWYVVVKGRVAAMGQAPQLTKLISNASKQYPPPMRPQAKRSSTWLKQTVV
jgi:hypothetical protein